MLYLMRQQLLHQVKKTKAINNGTWEANVKDAGGIMILGITIGIITPMPINNAENVSVRTEFFSFFPLLTCLDT